MSADRQARVPSKLILFGEEHLRRTLSKFVHHYHEQRQHQGIGNKLIAPNAAQRVAR